MIYHEIKYAGRDRADGLFKLLAVGRMLVAEARKNLSTAAPPHSRPGEYPHRITGDVLNSLFADVNASTMTLRFGSTSPHAIFLEFGTSKMAPRPFVRRTVAENRWRMLDIFAA